MPRPLLFVSALAATLTAYAGTCAWGADLPRELHQVGSKKVPVSNKTEITIRDRDDQDVKNRELWYSKFDGTTWGAWQKHGLSFSRETPITWSPTEGHWRVYIRIEEVSGATLPQPGPETVGKEFIIDRSAPAGAIDFPGNGARLRGGTKYTITWKAEDPHLHSQGVSLKWARDNDGEAKPIDGAQNIANTGSFDWTTPMDMTANGRLVLEMTDKAGNVGQAESTGIIIDAIAPSRNILGPEITASRSNDLAIRAQDAGPAGLAKVQLFYSQDNGATWNPGPEISDNFTSLPWQAPADGRYLLALIATDLSGNANPQPSGKGGAQFEILVDTEKPVLSLASSIGVSEPNAKANAPQRRIFKPGDQVLVDYKVKDANPRADGVTVYLQTDKTARWEVIGQGLPPENKFSFTLPDISTTGARIKVEAIDAAGNKGEVIAAEAFRVDNKVEAGTTEIDL